MLIHKKFKTLRQHPRQTIFPRHQKIMRVIYKDDSHRRFNSVNVSQSSLTFIWQTGRPLNRYPRINPHPLPVCHVRRLIRRAQRLPRSTIFHRLRSPLPPSGVCVGKE